MNLPSLVVLALAALAAVALEGSQVRSPANSAGVAPQSADVDSKKGDLLAQDPLYARKLLEEIAVTQTSTTGWSTILCSFPPMLATADIEASVPRLAGIFGHAFSFYIKRDAHHVWQDENIDWWLFWDNIDLVGCHFEEIQIAGKNSTPEAVRAAKEKAWVAVRQSIDRGRPAMALNPMTVEQRERGLAAYEWGLLIGYDEKKKTYTVAHKAQATAYEVPYDGFGHIDPMERFDVMWPTDPRPVDETIVIRRALEQALAYARGTRIKLEEAPFRVDALGLPAYDLWKQSLGDMSAGEVATYAGLLAWARDTAAAFCREVAPSQPFGAELLEAASWYEKESEHLRRLEELFSDDSDTDRQGEAAELLDRVIDAEKTAVAALQKAIQ